MNPEQYSIVTALPGARVGTFSSLAPVNFSGNTIAGVHSSFTVAGWVRRMTIGNEQILFQASGQFKLYIDANGALCASMFSGDSPVQVGTIADSSWHYVAASFNQDPDDNGAGYLCTYLDGIAKAEEAMTSNSTTADPECTLGADGHSDGVEFACWSIWNSQLSADLLQVPLWGVPQPGSPQLAGLLVSFDFAGPQITSSNSSVTFAPSCHKTVRPAFALTGSGVALANAPMPLAVSNTTPWSLLFWIRVPAQTQSGNIQPYTADGVDQSNEKFSFNVTVNVSSQSSLQIIRQSPSSDPQTLLSTPCDLTSWTHVAITYDSSLLKIYLNGQLQASTATTFNSGYRDAAIALNSDSNLNAGFLQSMSVWNRAVGADEIATLADSLSVQSPGLQAILPLLTDLRECLSGESLNLLGTGGIVNDEQIVTGPSSFVAAQPRTPRVPLTDSMLQGEDYWALANQLGIVVPARSAREIIDSQGGASNLGPHFDLPEPLRSNAIAKFDQSVRLITTLRERGVKTGQIEASHENGHTVFYYNGLSGRQEMLRVEFDLDPLTVWYYTILMDVIAVTLALVGVRVSAGAIGSAVRGRRLARVFPQLAAAIANSGQGAGKAMALVNVVVNILNTAGTLFGVYWDIITYSWWDMLFAGISVLSLVLWIVAPQAAALWQAASVVAVVAQLVYDLTQKPSAAVAARAPEPEPLRL